MLAKRGVRDRDTRHEPLSGCTLDRTTEPRDPRVACLTQHRVDARKELGRLEGLGDVVGRAARKATDLVHHLAARRKKDDGDRRSRGVALDAKAHIVSIGVRKHDVEEHEIWQELLHEFDPAAPVVCDGDDHSVRLQTPLQHVGRRLVVFDDDHAGRWRV